jgi:hypothetical protein
MAAFCACCGAEIKMKAEACAVCGTPRHGMLPPERQPAVDVGKDVAEDLAAQKSRKPRL